jgi:phage FluMu protein Com
MFKLEDRTLAEMESDTTPRKVSCVNCGKILSMAAYAMGAGRLDNECPFCHVTAEEYWKNKPHDIEWVVGNDKVENSDA